MTRDRSNGRRGREKYFVSCSTFTQYLKTEKEGRKDGEEEKCLGLEEEIPNGMLKCQSKMKPTCCCCTPGLII